MSENDSSGGDEGVEVGEASAGEAKELDPETAAKRAEDLGMQPQSALDERQEKLRPTRRWGGPDLDAETEARDEAVEEVEDIEPTETEEEPEHETG
jgi:hypothetical protein